MNPGDFTVVTQWRSDAPLRSDVVLLPEGGKALLRRLDPDFARSQRARRLFEIEIRTAAGLGPLPALAPVTGFGAGDELWLLRPFIETGSLEERLAAGHLSGEELMTLAERIIVALNAMHTAGVTHGDPSPSNVLLDGKGIATLSDPCSSRRAFVEGQATPPSFGRALDFSRLLSWVEREAARTGDLDGRRVREALSRRGTVEDRIESLWRTVEGAPDSPIRIPFPAREVVPATARAHVVLSVGRPPDPGSCFRAATKLIPFSRSSVAELRNRLVDGGLDVTVEWPEPARQLRDCLLEEGCTVSIRAIPGPSGTAHEAPTGGPRRAPLPIAKTSIAEKISPSHSQETSTVELRNPPLRERFTTTVRLKRARAFLEGLAAGSGRDGIQEGLADVFAVIVQAFLIQMAATVAFVWLFRKAILH